MEEQNIHPWQQEVSAKISQDPYLLVPKNLGKAPSLMENKVPAWTDGVDAKMGGRAVKDHGFYQGLEVKADTINVAPDGEQVLSEFIRITIGKIAFVQSSEDYTDCFWDVDIHPDDLKLVRTEGLEADKLDAYILGGTMSIQTHTKGVGWRVAGNVTNAIVSGVTFKVSEASRQRVIRDQCKNVHAWGEGVLVAEFDQSIVAPIDLAYNPYVHTTFVERHSDRPIAACKFLTVRDNRVFVSADALPVSRDSRVKVSRSWKPQLFTSWQLATAA